MPVSGFGKKSTTIIKNKMNKKEAQKVLTRLVEHLNATTLPIKDSENNNIDLQWAKNAAHAIENYLQGKSPSLDAAFGLTNKSGRPPDTNKHKVIAKKIFDMRMNNKSWNEIYDSLSDDNCTVTDPRSLQRIYNNFFIQIASEYIQIEDILPE